MDEGGIDVEEGSSQRGKPSPYAIVAVEEEMRSFTQHLIERHDGDGDCMSAAANLMMQFYTPFYGKQLKPKGSPVLIHALVYGQGAAKGLRFPHAWVEDGDTIYDYSNGRKIEMDRRFYYAIGKINPKEKGAYMKYAFSDMKKKLLSTGHYGPWDLDEKLEEAKGIVTNKSQIGKRRKRVDPKIIDALKEGLSEMVISESRGINKDRVDAGEIMVRDAKGVVWQITGYIWNPRYADKKPTKKVKGDFVPPELPEYLKAVKSASKKIGKLTSSTKGILLLKLTNSDGKVEYIGKFHTAATAPLKVSNSDIRDAGYERTDKSGGEFDAGGLNAAHFLKGHRTGGRSANPLFFFKTREELKNRIISNMKSSNFKLLNNKAMIAAVTDMIDGGVTKFDWSKFPNMGLTDKKKFGIFLVSELCYPFYLWDGKSIGAFPGLSTINYFAVPVSDTNPGVDSFVYGVDHEGKRVKVVVSSKSTFGSTKGASGSILPKLNSMANRAGFVPNNPFLAELLPYFKNTNKGIPSIYPFAVEKVLKMTGSIPNPQDLHRRLSILFPGPRSSTDKSLTTKQMEQTKAEVQAIQDRLRKGVSLPGVNLRYPPNTEPPGKIGDSKIRLTDQQLLEPKNWKTFGRYVSTIFCDFVVMGLNYDTSDFKPADVWQLTLDNNTFVSTGNIMFTAKRLRDVGNPRINQGKNLRDDPVRTNTWVGMEPAK